MKKLRGLAILLIGISLLTACKLTIEPPENGVVTSSDGRIECGDICESEYTKDDGDVELFPNADPGYVFSHWEGDCTGTSLCIFSAKDQTGDVKVKANFKQKEMSLQIKSNRDYFELSINTPKIITLDFDFTARNNEEYSLNLTDSVNMIAGDRSHLSLSQIPSVSSEEIKSGSFQVSQNILATESGIFTVNYLAEIGGVSAKYQIRINVRGPESDRVFQSASVYPKQINNLIDGTIRMSSRINSNSSSPLIIKAYSDVFLGELNDNGIDGDFTKEDKIYASNLNISEKAYLKNSCFPVTLATMINDQLYTSKDEDLCVSDILRKKSPSDLTNIIESEDNDLIFISDEIVLNTNPHLTPSELLAITRLIDGDIKTGSVARGHFIIKLKSPVSSEEEMNDLLEILRKEKNVKNTAVNPVVSIQSSTGEVKPNDPLFNSNQLSKFRNINLLKAWSKAKGKEIIAIVDTGVDLSHPDLVNKIIPGINLVSLADVQDDNGHGTHVAGIAAANTNNGKYIAGVSWESKVLVIKALDKNGRGSYSDLTESIRYAADQGVRIINVSAGQSFEVPMANLCGAVDYATSRGAIVVASAGNKNESKKLYPAACPNAIAVGSSNGNRNSPEKASYSNYGSWLDIMAPGSSTTSTVPTNVCRYCNNNGYKIVSGTSQAAPIISGAISLITELNPSIGLPEIEQRLKTTGVKLSTPIEGMEEIKRIDVFEFIRPEFDTLLGDIDFEDEYFRECIYSSGNVNDQTYQSDFTRLNIDSRCQKITSIKGVKSLTDLIFFDIRDLKISEIDLENLLSLNSIYIDNIESLQELDVSNLKKLSNINVRYTDVSEINLRDSVLLEKIRFEHNYSLINVIVPASDYLKEISIYYAALSSLDITKALKLEELNVYETNLEEIDISKNTHLKVIYLYNNNLSFINVDNNVDLETLYLSHNPIVDVSVSELSKLKTLVIHKGNIVDINLENNLDLEHLQISGSPLLKLNLSNNIKLKTMQVIRGKLTKLNLKSQSELKRLEVWENELESIELPSDSQLTDIIIDNNNLEQVDFGTSINIKSISTSGNNTQSLDITNLSNLESFTAALSNVVNFTMGNNPKLKFIYLKENKIKNISFSNLDNIKIINLMKNPLTLSTLDYLATLTGIDIRYCSNYPWNEDDPDSPPRNHPERCQ